MLFTSFEFLFFFMPITILVNYVLPAKARNYWLLATSLFFYAWGEPVFVFVMIGTIVFNYGAAMLLSLPKRKALRKVILSLSVIADLSVLFVYKYYDFAVFNLNRLIPATASLIQPKSIPLPIGISFFTFQAISYIVDVYRGKAPVQKNPFHVGLYIALFPQLISGPIVRYNTIMEEIRSRRLSLSEYSAGVIRFITGFNKKILLANVIAVAVDSAWANTGRSTLQAWLGMGCYILQLYFDFSGYSDMAIGLGQMLGFHFNENFDHPFMAKSVSEYWRRWHISLGTWYRDYLYFPLGGSRVRSKARLFFNLMLVWLITGLWHGAGWTFVVWGLINGVLVCAEKLTSIPEYASKRLVTMNLYRVFSLVAVIFSFMFFRSQSLSIAFDFAKSLIGHGCGLVDAEALFMIREYFVYIIAAVLCGTTLFRTVRNRMGNAGEWIYTALQLILFVVSVSSLAVNAHNPFIYFNF